VIFVPCYNHKIYHGTKSQASINKCIQNDVGSSHMVVWQPRTRRWSRHTDVTGSSDAKPKKDATRQSDNSDHIKRQFELVTRLGQSSISMSRAVRSLMCSNEQPVHYTTNNLLMWGKDPHIDTSPHINRFN
jgi:hypothetical protein